MAANRTSFSVLFDYNYFPRGTAEEQRRQQNTIILGLTSILTEAGENWNDTLPITRTQPYAFLENQETKVANLKSFLRLADYSTADQCMAALVETYMLENYTPEEQRTAAGVQYEITLRQFSSSNPFVFSTDISRDTMYKIQENNSLYIGVDVQTSPVREYVSGTIAPHLIGFIGPIDADEYAELQKKGYKLNDTVGKTGIESAMEVPAGHHRHDHHHKGRPGKGDRQGGNRAARSRRYGDFDPGYGAAEGGAECSGRGNSVAASAPGHPGKWKIRQQRP